MVPLDARIVGNESRCCARDEATPVESCIALVRSCKSFGSRKGLGAFQASRRETIKILDHAISVNHTRRKRKNLDGSFTPPRLRRYADALHVPRHEGDLGASCGLGYECEIA